jgi:ribonuclease Z
VTFSLTILGTSSAFPTSKRYPTAHVLNVCERFFLIDCGEGTQIQLRNNRIKFGKLNHIFISHLHGDHFFGLFGLISTQSLLGRKTPLHIYSPAGLESIVNNLFRAVNDVLPFELIFHEIDGKVAKLVYEDKHICVESIPLKHRIPTYGYLFKEKLKVPNIKKKFVESYKPGIKEMLNIKKGADYISSEGKVIPNEQIIIPAPKPRSYAFCSDTAYSEKIVEQLKDVDLLYHEATFLEEAKKLAKQSYHSTARQAATIAHLANAGQLIIGHFSARYKQFEPFLEEAKEFFDNTVLAKDNLLIEL